MTENCFKSVFDDFLIKQVFKKGKDRGKLISITDIEDHPGWKYYEFENGDFMATEKVIKTLKEIAKNET